ncbi:MAG: prolyl oligopeptidase family serine peptidase, partial [Streptosporangiaceae bacterium]|nr:prolyl oligopeptidase family serine peptidase [Streptosporangiaceae bacterium]
GAAAGGAQAGAQKGGVSAGNGPWLVPTRTPALEPRPDPGGRRVAYVHDGTLRVAGLGETGEPPGGELADHEPADHEVADHEVAGEPGVTYGLAEFVAAEEMERTRGYWWSPDGARLLIARVDESPVRRWYIADPANPGRPPAEVAYPAAGTPNADVSLTLATLDGERTPVEWDAAAFPYLVTAVWDEDLLIVVQSRDQKTMRVIMNGEVIREDTDPHWVDIVPGVPAQLADGRIVWTQTSEDTRRLIIGLPAELGAAKPVTPAGLQVREILGTDGDTVLFTASTEPTQIALWSYGAGGLTEVSGRPGVHTGRRAGGTTVVSSRYLDEDGAHVRINSTAIDSLAQRPNLPSPQPVIFGAGPSGIRTAVLFPSSHRPGSARLPVLLDPYGGPHAQRVLKARGAYLTSQWFAEQGFAVVVADGRGTGGRGPGWDRAVAGDLAAPVLEDQVTALQAAAGRFGDLDTGRVAIRGWSFGGYLAALAVLRRPDVFHAAIAGAPVTDWRLYDTHYTERYLGDPGSSVTVYDRCSLIEDAERAVVPAGGSGEPSGAGRVFRPLLVIHGLADDNVVAAHTLRLSSALLAAGYPHSVLPLSGVTHMTPQEVVAENLLLLQAGFLRDALSRE